MKAYLIALAVGLLVGIIYGALNVRSPAPPVIALVGLFGMLVGEQVPPLAKKAFADAPVTIAMVKNTCWNHMFGRLPQRHETAPAASPPSDERQA